MVEEASIDSRKLLEGIAINNARSLAIHLVVSFVGFMLLMIFGFVGMTVSAVLGLALYVCLGYRFLTPLPRFNFASVLGILFLLGAMFGIPYALSLASPSVEDDLYHTLISLGQLGLFNLSAIEVINTIFVTFFGYSHHEVGVPSPPVQLTHFIAAFIPSLFIYLGLCLKVWLHKKEIM